MSTPRTIRIFALASLVLLAACGDDGVSSEEAARRSYLGLDLMVGKAMDLGFVGFNTASSANIAPQSGVGNVKGTMQITGQVDQGTSANKGMRLFVELSDYQDNADLESAGINVVYATTAGALPALNLSLKSIPTGTLTGSLAGAFNMTGDLQGAVTLALAFAGELQPNALDGAKVERKPGTTRVTGTATSSYGTYNIDVTR